MVSPTDHDLIQAVMAIREWDPTLARAKVLKQLKEENGWELSEKRLKACMDTNNLGATAPTIALESLKPRDAAFHEVIKEAAQEFTKLEREFLMGLSKEDAKALIPVPGIKVAELPLKVTCQQRHYVEFLLTLKGIKPCTVIFHPFDTQVFTRLANEVLKPIMKKYKLRSFGFELRQIEHPTMIDMGRPKSDTFWRGGWFFADIISPHWSEIQNLYCSPTPIDVSRSDIDTYQDRICKILGYPVNGYPRQENFNRVCYMDETECQELARLTGKSEDVIEVIGLEYEDDDGDEERWMRCLIHFESCKRAMASVGRNLELDLRGHDGLFDHVHNRKG
ncbi:hypothetical protein VTL71DRAFT_6893 [Oculimacula yallundae]|uniref:Uncharacterized protein n=1 Tax=Oculimacula yallundae TaxID=86028 RepID=A0ABR4BWL7_9HELO